MTNVDGKSGVNALSDVVADHELLRNTPVEAVSRVLGLSVRQPQRVEEVTLYGHRLSAALAIDIAA